MYLSILNLLTRSSPGILARLDFYHFLINSSDTLANGYDFTSKDGIVYVWHQKKIADLHNPNNG